MRYKAPSDSRRPARLGVRFDIALFDVTQLPHLTSLHRAGRAGEKLSDVCCSPLSSLLQPSQARRTRPGLSVAQAGPAPSHWQGNLPVKILSVVDKKVRQESQPERASSETVRQSGQLASTKLYRDLSCDIREVRGAGHQIRETRQPASRPARTQGRSSDINIISQQWAGL